ncbi:DUF6392 family protein [Pseudomonas sp. NPDC089407]|uniref:DUF6392 family protein n=1 Tax=Pseudomonas sp. NPDC089407 TaxID=3364464 RepID=UPI00384B076F
MDSHALDRYLSSLGRCYNDLVLEDLAVPEKLVEIFSGSFTMVYEPEPGLELEFWAETQKFEKLHFALKKTTPSSVLYKGKLDEPYEKCRTRELVLQSFGSPISSKGKFKMPLPMGEVGGWDTFDLGPLGYAERQVTFKYDSKMYVSGVTFSLKLTGFDKMRIEELGL